MHYAKLLPGNHKALLISADRIQQIEAQITSMEDNLRIKKAMLTTAENDLTALIERAYTAEEITQAKKEAEHADLPF